MTNIEKITKNTNISLGLAIVFISMLGGTFMMYKDLATDLATLTAQVSSNQLKILQIEKQCNDNPSRQEFQSMQTDVREIRRILENGRYYQSAK